MLHDNLESEKAEALLDALEQEEWNNKIDSESAEAKAIRDRAQKSAIQTMSDSISAGITEALIIRAKMAGQPEPEPFVIQIEESQARAEATMIQALGAQANAGNLPPVALYNYAVKSGLFEGSYDEWRNQLQGAVV